MTINKITYIDRTFIFLEDIIPQAFILIIEIILPTNDLLQPTILVINLLL